jgi:hypothetical protein
MLLEGLASCHAITYVNNQLIGDPLDVKMFESTKWVLDEPKTTSKVDEIVLAYVRPSHMDASKFDYKQQDSSVYSSSLASVEEVDSILEDD